MNFEVEEQFVRSQGMNSFKSNLEIRNRIIIIIFLFLSVLMCEMVMFVPMFAALKEMPIAIKTDKPKTQHYELPTSFFKLVLGKNLKYRYVHASWLEWNLFFIEVSSVRNRSLTFGALNYIVCTVMHATICQFSPEEGVEWS